MKYRKKLQSYHYFNVFHHQAPFTKQYIKTTLLGLIDELKMKPLSQVIMKPGTSDAGWTGIIIIEQSHIAFHSFDEQKETWIDIVSCKKFSKKRIEKYLYKYFK